MKLLLDSVVFQKENRKGIACLFREILPRMCDLEPKLQITLFVDGPLYQELPSHPHITIRKTIPVKRTLHAVGLWRSFLYPFRRSASLTWNLIRGIWLGQGKGVIWHSTYYTEPKSWHGMKVVSVYDMIHEHFLDLYDDPLDDVARQQKQHCVENADAIICISQTTLQDLVHYYRIEFDKLHVIPIAYSPVFTRLEFPITFASNFLSQPFLLYVGNRSHYKNFQEFIEVYSQWDSRKEVAIVVVGNRWSDEESRLLERLGITERIELLSDVNEKDLCRIYNLALAFVFPSLYEGFGIPLLEALACGCPVIASHIPSTVEVAGECPIYFEPSHPETLVSALDRIRIEGKTQKRIEEGIKQARRYSWEKTAQQTLDVYRTLDKAMH